jgi:hypothetical protein
VLRAGPADDRIRLAGALASLYSRTMAIVEDAIGGLSSRERASVLGGTAQHLWNL